MPFSASSLTNRRPALIAAGLVIVVLFIIGTISRQAGSTVIIEPISGAEVSMTTARAYAGGETISLIGSVRPAEAANITAERAGRVTSVPVTLGQRVSAGQVIATLESASEQAAVLQAEGVYDAAVAAASQSGISVDEANTGLANAENTARTALSSAYNTTNSIVLNSVDQLFSAPNTTVPGLRINGRSYTNTLNSQRIAFQTILPEWQQRVSGLSNTNDLHAEIVYATAKTTEALNMVDTFILVFSEQDSSSRYTVAELTAFRTEFTNLRASLINVRSSLSAAESGLKAAEDSVRRAELGAPGSTNSAADAQVKQALGALRAAQANLAKTVLRTPIAGTVNSLSVRTGDFVSMYGTAAEIATNNTLEVVTYVSDRERNSVAVGDEVRVDTQYLGTITEIAPAVDAATRKTEVRISVADAALQAGDTVRVEKVVATEAEVLTIQVPLTAVKFEVTDGYVFAVSDGVLEARPVTLGTVRGDSIEIIGGITADTSFVVDARGLQAGDEVIVRD